MHDATDNAWQALSASPHDAAPFRRLLESLRASSDWAGLIRLYRQRAAAVEPPESVLLHLTVAEQWARRLGDREAVDRAYADALAAARPHASSRDALRELFWKRGRWPLLADLLRQDVDRAEAGPDRAGAWLELARFLVVKVGARAEAAEAFRSAFRESHQTGATCREELENLRLRDPDEPALTDVLEEIYRERGESAPLYELLTERRQREVDANVGPPVGFTLELDLARLAGRDLGHWEAAIDHLRHASELDPTRRSVVRRTASELGRLYPEEPHLLGFIEETSRADGDWEAALDAVLGRLTATQAPAEVAALNLQAAELLLDRLGRAADAVLHLGRALEADPSDLAGIAALYLRAAERGAPRPGLEEPLAAALLEARQLEPLLTMQRLRLRRLAEPAEQAPLRCQVADLHLVLGRPDEALAEYRVAADHVAEGPVLDRILAGLFRMAAATADEPLRDATETLIEDLARRTERWDDVLRLLAARLERAREPKPRATLHDALGQLIGGPLGRADAAAGHFLKAAELAPGERAYQERARRALVKAGRFEEAAARFEAELPLCDSDEQRAALVAETASLLQDSIGDAPAATALRLEHLGRGPAWSPVRRRLIDDLSGSDGSALIEHLLAEAADRGALAARIAEVMRDLVAPAGGNLAPSAVPALLALDRHARLPAALDAPLERALINADRHADRADVLERRAERATETEPRRQALESLVVVCLEALDDADRAVAAAWRLLDGDPDGLAGPATFARVQALGELLRKLGRSTELARLHDAIIERLDPPAPTGQVGANAARPELGDLLRRHARLQADELGRPDLAAETWRRLLRLDPLNAEATAFFRGRYDSAEGAATLYEVLSAGIGGVTDPVALTERHAELGELAAGRLHDDARARAHFETALELARQASDEGKPAARRAVDGLRRLASASGDEAELLAVARAEQALLDEEARRERVPELLERVEALGDHPEARAALAELVELAQAGELDDPELLERAADTALQCDDPQREADFVAQLVALEPRPAWRLRLARILGDELERPADALAIVDELLADKPADRILVDLAIHLHLTLGREPELLRLLRAQAGRAPDDASRVAVLERLAAHAEPGLTDGADDLRGWALRGLMTLQPERTGVVERLARHHEDAGRWPEAISALREGLGRSPEPAARADLLRRIGSIYEHELGDLDRARDAYAELAEGPPDDVGAVRALLRLADKQADERAVVELAARLQTLDPAASDIDALVDRALALADEGGRDPGQRIALLTGRTRRDPLDRASLERLAELLEQAERWEELADVLDRLAGLATSDRQRIELWTRRADVLEERLGDGQTAGAVYQDVLQMHPGNRLALNALKRLHTDLGRWPGVLWVLSRLAQLESDPGVRAAVLREMADVHETRLDAPEEALALHREAHELLVDETTSLQALKRLAADHGLWEPYAEVLRHDAARAGSPGEQRARLSECAEVLEQHLEQPQRAFDLLFERFDLTPRDEALFDQLRGLCLRAGLWDALRLVYERLARTRLEPADQVALLHELAELLVDRAGDPSQALLVLDEAFARRPGDAETLARMESLAGKHELWQALDGIYQARIDEAEQVGRQVGLLLQRAELLERRLGRHDEAFEQLVLALQLDPRSDEVVDALHGMAEASSDLWPTLVKLYEVLVKEHEEPALRVRHLRAIARIASERLGDRERAFDVIARAWRIDPSREDLRTELVAAAEAADRLDRLADAFAWEAENRVDPADRIAALERLAALCRDQLDDLPRAVHAYTEAFAIDPDRTETLAALRDLLLERDEWELLLGVLTQWVPRARSAAQQRRLFRTMAEVAEERGRLREAVEAWRGVLAIDPRDLEALSGLARLHREAGDWDRVAHCLEQSIGVASDPDRRAELLLELARLFKDLGRLERAADTLERFVDAFPDRQWPTAELVEIDLRLGRADEAVRHLERAGADEVEPTHAAEALMLAAELAAVELADAKRGLRLAERATRLAPGSRKAWLLTADLAGLAERWRDRVEALRALAELPEPEDVGLSEEHVESLRASLAVHEALGGGLLELPPPSARSLYLGLAARTLEERLFYPDRALGLWQRAAHDAGDWPLPELEVARLAEAAGEGAVAEEAMRRAAAKLERLVLAGPVARVWTRLADRMARDSTRLVHALGAYESALAADPTVDGAYARYEALLKRHDRLSRARDFFAELMASDLDPERRRGVLVLQARSFEALGEPEAASQALEVAHGLARDDPSVNRALADMAFERGDNERALDLYAGLLELRRAQRADRDGDEGALRKRLAACAEGAGRIDLAQAHYSDVHGSDPGDPEALLGLGRLALRRGATALAQNYLDETRALARDGGEPAPTLGLPVWAQARLLEGDISAARGDRKRAVELWEPLARRDGSAGRPARERLVEAYAQLSKYDHAVDLLKHLEGETPAGPARIELLLRRADLARTRLDDVEQAWEATAVALALSGGDPAIQDRALELAVAVGRWDEAAQMAETALRNQTEPAEVARIRLLAGAAAAGRGDLTGARAHYSGAVRLDPFNVRAIEGLIDAATQQRDWTRLRQELESALERVGRRRPAVRGVILRALGDVLSGMLLDRRGALDVYAELAELYPDDVEMHRKRLDLYRKTTPVDGAGVVATTRRLARLGVLEISAVRFLKDWYQRSERRDGAFVMTELLALCGEATPAERHIVQREARRARPESLAAGLADEIRCHHRRGEPVSPLIVDHLGQAALAVAARDAQPRGPAHHRHDELAELAAALGRPGARLLWGHGGVGTTVVNCRSVTVLADPDEYGALSEAQERFEVGALAWLCQPEAVMSAVLNEFEYVTFHEAALDRVRRADDGFEPDDSMAASVRGWHEVFGWLGGGPAVPEPQKMDRDELPSPLAWRERCRQTAWRVGLLYCDSLSAAIARLVAREPALSGRPIRSLTALQQAMTTSQSIRQLVAFALSDDFLDARARLGLARTDVDLNGAADGPQGEGDAGQALRDKSVAAFELEIDEGGLENDEG